ncbi:MAG TPA: hypothetical protein VFT55_03880, partial [Planctomycetota bacterium]|nr:hypothetical protein [Planctomycetota bacterium]
MPLRDLPAEDGLRKELTTVLVLVSVLAVARTQSGPKPAELVEQLVIPERRARTRELLLALGKEAVPSIAERLRTPGEIPLTELLALLVDLGPDAGAAVPQLCDAFSKASKDNLVPMMWAIAELAPYRAP